MSPAPSAASRAEPAPIRATTTLLDHGPDLVEPPPAAAGLERTVAWLRNGQGLVGWGETARIDVGTGPGRFARAAGALADLFASMEIDTDVEGWGTGPLAFGSFAFDADAPGSALVIPAVVVGRAENRTWLTTTRRAGQTEGPTKRPPQATHDQPAPLDETTFARAVESARQAIRGGRLDKVVLSLQVVAESDRPFDPAQAIRRLAAEYPQCFTFAFGSLVGASPELLIRRQGRKVWSQPLAGSCRRGATPEEDERLGAALLASHKDRWEHDLAVVTVVEALRPLCRTLRIDPEPSLLRLANVTHLATEASGELKADPAPSALDLAGAVHPTAAVCGTPTRRALALIRELEGAGRGRYAGPVGWVDARGDGEWAIALRCAELEGTRARLYAGAGIVEESEPAAELEEARLKLRPTLSALGLT